MHIPVITKFGEQVWRKNTLRHRVGAPAIRWPAGSKAYFQNGKLHRVNGPAFIGSDGYQQYWRNDKQIV